MTPRLLLRSEAQADLEAAVLWYERRSIGLGGEFLRVVRVALAGIERSRDAYPVVLDDIRRAGVRRFPYFIFYVARESDTSVIAVLHGRRDPHSW
ncbi:MAG: type II toxin-antitoxin system RelE/ParE family toxin [Gemmatimonadales bacterium]|nr:type II toxin-antitoxin system RelE/ParE family toxin [Gemmatimonadales bacterium]MDZ4390583.1 type II toxin-antitoxin system RelE/ParE family toxin [Gemmatimonadales bacterium]